REGGGVAAPEPWNLLDRPLQVLRPDIATVDDDEVLGAPGDDQLLAEPVAEIAGVEPAGSVENERRRLGLPEVAGHDARALDEDAPDAPFRQWLAVVVADLRRMPDERPAAGDKGAALRRVADRRRHGDALVGHAATVDDVDLHAGVERREADRE